MLHDHAAAFYDDDQEVVDIAAAFVADGLRQLTRSVVVATPEHLAGIERALLAQGLDPDEPPVAGNLVMLDARRALTSLTTADGLDEGRFTDMVAQLLRDVGADNTPVRVFGELAALLWTDGDKAGAIELEKLCNAMLHRADFVLLCAYSSALVDTGVLADVHAVCGQHSHVEVPTRCFDPGNHQITSPRVFLPLVESIASSRQFVESCLRRMGAGDQTVADARLIVSELATNAVQHAHTSFRVSVDESAGVLCISVQDMGDGRATLRVTPAGSQALDGRGIGIVDSLATRWGCDLLTDGKVVWAELAA